MKILQLGKVLYSIPGYQFDVCNTLIIKMSAILYPVLPDFSTPPIKR